MRRHRAPRSTRLPSVALPPGKTDEDYVLALLRETGILCVHGSGFGMRPRKDSFASSSSRIRVSWP